MALSHMYPSQYNSRMRYPKCRICMAFDPIRDRLCQAEARRWTLEPVGAALGLAFAARLPASRDPDAWDSLAAAAQVPGRGVLRRKKMRQKLYRPIFHYSFLHPKFWGVWLALCAVWLCAFLPRRLVYAVGAPLARILHEGDSETAENPR